MSQDMVSVGMILTGVVLVIFHRAIARWDLGRIGLEDIYGVRRQYLTLGMVLVFVGLLGLASRQ